MSAYGYLSRCRGPHSTGRTWCPTEVDLHLHLLNLQGAPASFATRRTYLRFHTAWTRSRHCRQVADSSLRTPQAMDWVMDLLQAKKPARGGH